MDLYDMTMQSSKGFVVDNVKAIDYDRIPVFNSGIDFNNVPVYRNGKVKHYRWSSRFKKYVLVK